jgi:hypothetical protein
MISATYTYGLSGLVKEDERPAVDYSRPSIEVFADTTSLLSTLAWQAVVKTESGSSLAALRELNFLCCQLGFVMKLAGTAHYTEFFEDVRKTEY